MPIFLERSVLGLPRIYINGGRRGYLLGHGSGAAHARAVPSLLTWPSRSNLAPQDSRARGARERSMATEGLNLATEPRENPAGAGVEWIAEGWRFLREGAAHVDRRDPRDRS
jgi:hypothetical protein